MCSKTNRRLGIVGIRGGLSRAQMTVHHGGAAFVAACDISEEKRKTVEELGVKAYADFDAMLAKADLDSLIVATPNDLHCEMVLKAYEKGCDVFCEKPMATNIPDCVRMIEAADAADKLLMVGFCYRHANFFRKFVELAREEKIGPPLMLWCKEFRGFWGHTGDVWRLSQKRSGGAIVEKNCHHFDIFNWVAQALPKRVAAFGGNAVYTDSESIDNAVVIVEYENGIRGELHLSLFMSHYNELEIGVLGQHGKLESLIGHAALGDELVEEARKHKGGHGKIAYWKSGEKPETIYAPPTYSPLWPDGKYQHLGTANQFEEFARCLNTGEKTAIDGRIGLESLLICCAAEKAIQDGRVIDVAELYETE